MIQWPDTKHKKQHNPNTLGRSCSAYNTMILVSSTIKSIPTNWLPELKEIAPLLLLRTNASMKEFANLNHNHLSINNFIDDVVKL